MDSISAISPVFPAISYVFSSVPNIFFAVSYIFPAVTDIFDPVSYATVMSCITDVFPAVSYVFPSVPHIFSAISYIFLACQFGFQYGHTWLTTLCIGIINTGKMQGKKKPVSKGPFTNLFVFIN